MCKYDKLVAKIKRNLGTDNITVSVTTDSIIVDRTDRTECVVEIGNYYNAPYVQQGSNMVTDITCEDLEDFGILTPIPNIDKDCSLELEPFSYTIQMPRIRRWNNIPVDVFKLACKKRYGIKHKRHINNKRIIRYKRYLKRLEKVFKTLTISYKEDINRPTYDYLNEWMGLAKQEGDIDVRDN